jgi:polyisoprenoid-binding protein YceI
VRTGTKVAIGAGAAVLLVGTAAVIFGPSLYADWANRAAAEAPVLGETTGPLPDPATLDGVWVVTDGSFAGYRVNEVLRGENVTVTGRTEQVDGTVTVDDGAISTASVTVDMASVATDEPPRDAYFRGSVIGVGTHPSATFAVSEPVPLAVGATDVDIPVSLRIRGVSRDVTVDAQVASGEAGVQVIGSVPVTFADFGVEAPSLGFVTVEEQGSVEFSLVLERER